MSKRNWPTHPGMALPRPTPEGIAHHAGECEWCGLVDHHLDEGQCPSCKAKIDAQACEQDDDVPMGYEAADPGRTIYGMPSLRRAVLGK